MAETDVSSLIMELDGELHSGRGRAAKALARIAEKNDDAEQLERIAGALRARGFIDELMGVYARYRELTRPDERSKLSIYSGALMNAAERRPHHAFWIIRELEKLGVPAIPVLMAALDMDTDYVGGCAKNALAGIAIGADRATVEGMINKAHGARQKYLEYPQNEITERKFILLEDLLRMLRSVRDSKPLVAESIRPAKEAGKKGGAASAAPRKLTRPGQ